jgi:hypothetical protein
LPFPTEAQGFDPAQPGEGVRKVKLHQVDFLQGLADADFLVHLFGGGLQGLEAGRRLPVSDIHIVVPGRRGPDPGRFIRDFLRPALGGEYDGAGPVRPGAHIQELDGIGKHGGFQYVFDRNLSP